MPRLLAEAWPTVVSLAVLAGLVGGVIAYARRPRPSPARAEMAPTLIPADSTDFTPSTVAQPLARDTRAVRRTRDFDDTE